MGIVNDLKFLNPEEKNNEPINGWVFSLVYNVSLNHSLCVL